MRSVDWPERLAQCVDDAIAVPFEYGKNDCVTFAAACAKAITGIDYLADVVRWHSEQEADMAIQSVGGLVLAMDQRFARKKTLMAMRGDIIGYTGKADLQLAVVQGSYAVAPGASGLVAVVLSDANICWDVC